MNLDNNSIRLRPVCEEDCRLLWQWVNDPVVRATSLNSEPIPWENHVSWFAPKLNARNCHIFIAIDRQDRPIGQVRFDINDDREADITVSIDPQKRGLGYGHPVIDLAIREVFQRDSILVVRAFIKLENKASIRAFQKANFKNIGKETVKGHLVWHYERRKNDTD